MAKRKRYGYHTLNFRMTVAEVSATKGEHDKQKSCVTKSNKIQTAGMVTIDMQFHGTCSPGEGYSANAYLHGEAPPRGPNPYLLHTIFHEKGTPFIYLV